MDITSLYDSLGVSDSLSTDVPLPDSIDFDLSIVDTFLRDYSPVELTEFNLSPRPDTTSTTASADCAITINTSADQSGNDSDSDITNFEIEMLQWRKNKRTKPQRSGRKDEIAALHAELQRLQNEFKTLEFRTGRRAAASAILSGPSSSRTRALWRQLAQSQLERRRRSEEENSKLREMVIIQILEAKNLRRILKRRTRIEMMHEMLGSRGLPGLITDTSPNDPTVFQRLLDEADELFVGIDNLFSSKGMDSFPLSGHSRATDLEVTNGVYYEMLQKREFPFDKQTTAKAVWECFRNLGEANLRGVGRSEAVLNAHPHITEDDGDTLRRSFFAVISGLGDFEGTYTQKVARRYNHSVFIARMVSEPRYRGSKRGVSATTSMQVVLEEGEEGASTTVMKVYFGAERRELAAKEDPATVLAFAAWDELVPRFPVDVETFVLDNLCGSSV